MPTRISWRATGDGWFASTWTCSTYGHLAFEVADVASALQKMIDHGGEPLGKVARTTVAGVGELEVTYARDPEGNIIELQAWR